MREFTFIGNSRQQVQMLSYALTDSPLRLCFATYAAGYGYLGMYVRVLDTEYNSVKYHVEKLVRCGFLVPVSPDVEPTVEGFLNKMQSKYRILRPSTITLYKLSDEMENIMVELSRTLELEEGFVQRIEEEIHENE
ncbi:MAG: hypothetical protein CL811_12635 [Colwelliaceae bacterium]|nr:hypothetical protein [Colwelliaceae bacterium]